MGGGSMSDTLDKATDVFQDADAMLGGDRHDDYGDPAESFKRIAGLYSAYLGIKVSPTDVAMLLALLKISRAKSGPGKKDSFVDLAAYGALGWAVQENLIVGGLDASKLEATGWTPQGGSVEWH